MRDAGDMLVLPYCPVILYLVGLPYIKLCRKLRFFNIKNFIEGCLCKSLCCQKMYECNIYFELVIFFSWDLQNYQRLYNTFLCVYLLEICGEFYSSNKTSLVFHEAITYMFCFCNFIVDIEVWLSKLCKYPSSTNKQIHIVKLKMYVI